MRLIDADEIEYESVAKEDRKGGFYATDIVEKEDIDKMPTIEAIPIVWIEKNMGELIAQGHNLQASYFAEIISLWREEHEAD